MRTSPAGIALIKTFEGLELEAYQDIAGVWTIGYGHTETAAPGQRITEDEAEALLRRDLRPRENAVERLSSVDLNQNEFDALVSFVYNVGEAAFRGSTARARLNRGDRLGAADALTWWNKATVNGVLREVTGLTRRRAAERALFLTPVEPVLVSRTDVIEENSRVQPVEDGPRRGSLAESRTLQGATVAGGAGAAASTMGRDSAEELDQLEANIETGEALTADASAGEGSLPQSPPETAPDDTLLDGEIDATTDPDVVIADEEPGDGDNPTTPDSGDPMVLDENGEPLEEGEASDGEPAIATPNMRPSKHEVHAVEAQIQFALLIIIALAVLYIFIARIDDWLKYRR